VNSAVFQTRLEEHGRPVIVDFWAPWCGPCRAMAPLLADLEREFEGRVDVWRVNVDTDAEAATAFSVRVIPTLLGVHGGREVTRMIGAPSRTRLRSLFEQAETGVAVAPRIARRDRALRTAAAAGLALVGWRTGATILYIAAALTMLAALHDVFLAPFRSRR
jgi:thioredoxin 1